MNRRSWRPEEIEVLRAMWPRSTANEVHVVIPGRSTGSIYEMARRMGLQKDPDYMAARREQEAQNLRQHGKRYRFNKGQVSHNKGVKGITGSHPNTRANWFTKGHDNGKAMPIGTERVTTDGYLARKVSDVPYGGFGKNWEFVHRIVWEEHNGPIPAGHIVIFRNKDRMDVRIENLELINRKEHGARNSLANLPEALQATIRTSGALTRVINTLKGKQRERAEEQS